MKNCEYFARRAEQEALRAQKAKSAPAVLAHTQMSTAYFELAQRERGAPDS